MNERLIAQGILANTESIKIPYKFINTFGLSDGTLLAQLIYLDQKFKTDDGWFSVTHNELEKTTLLSTYQQNKILKKMYDVCLLDRKFEGLPCRNYYKIEYETLIRHITESCWVYGGS